MWGHEHQEAEELLRTKDRRVVGDDGEEQSHEVVHAKPLAVELIGNVDRELVLVLRISVNGGQECLRDLLRDSDHDRLLLLNLGERANADNFRVSKGSSALKGGKQGEDVSADFRPIDAR